MRTTSLAIYVLSVLLAWLATRRSLSRSLEDRNRIVRHFLFKAIAVSGAAYVIGAAAIVASAHTGMVLSAPISLSALFLLKCIGAPLSIAFVYLFAQLPYPQITHTAVPGLLGAFVLNNALGTIGYEAGFTPMLIFWVGSAFIACGALLVIIGFSQAKAGEVAAGTHSRHIEAAAPLHTLINRNLVVGVIAASMMLGFLRAGMSSHTSDTPAALMIALILIAMLSLAVNDLGMHKLFRGALLCTAAGFLLGPLVFPVAADASTLLVGIGTALFEVVVWIVAVTITRACTDPFFGAAAVRLAIVAGHLIGALLANGAVAATGNHPDALQTASFVIVFAYIVMLVYLFNDTTARLPFTAGNVIAPSPSHVPAGEGSIPLSPDTPDSKLSSAARTSLSNSQDSPEAATGQDNTIDHEVWLWDMPCQAIARAHHLTPRETEILGQLARGRDLSYIEEKFVLSRNTIKMHIRHIYEKLDVHSKQEVIDLVENERAQP